MDQGDAQNEDGKREGALALLNTALIREGFEAFYGPDKKCTYAISEPARWRQLRLTRTVHSQRQSSKGTNN